MYLYIHSYFISDFKSIKKIFRLMFYFRSLNSFEFIIHKTQEALKFQKMRGSMPDKNKQITNKFSFAFSFSWIPFLQHSVTCEWIEIATQHPGTGEKFRLLRILYAVKVSCFCNSRKMLLKSHPKSQILWPSKIHKFISAFHFTFTFPITSWVWVLVVENATRNRYVESRVP